VEHLRDLPSVDTLAASLDAPHAAAVAAARVVVGERRAELLAGATGSVDLTARARALLEPSLRRVLNATGVIVHTNLGRAPLAPTAREAVARAAEGYSNLELDLETGGRGSRHDHVEWLLRTLTGAEAAMAVNNGAGAVLLAAASNVPNGSDPSGTIVVSRGQLVEIGGGFRIPEVVGQAGARLVEVGTTNRTRLDDYRRAIGPETRAILRAHQSNFRQVGFVEEVSIEDLCSLGVPVIDDVGSGTLGELYDEPPVRRSVAAGAALVCFSGDKLLGGPQAGLIVGSAEAVDAARRHPLARALRIDKLSLAALEATLRLYLDPSRARAEIPVLRMLDEDPEPRARRLADAVGGELVQSVAKVGGGALPLLELPGPVVAIAGEPDSLAARLRAGDPPLVGRIEDGRLVLDPRTLTDDEVDAAAGAVRAAIG
jgi:L-seryl-tRNA(Ser) seleniumtransferase